MTRGDLLGLFMLVALSGLSCSRAPHEENASAEQIAYLQEGLNPGFTIRHAYAIPDEHGMQAYDLRAGIYGPGLEHGATMTWRMAGPKHAPKYALITSRIPAYGVIRWLPAFPKTVDFHPEQAPSPSTTEGSTSK
jgi:hypothetical protein